MHDFEFCSDFMQLGGQLEDPGFAVKSSNFITLNTVLKHTQKRVLQKLVKNGYCKKSCSSLNLWT